VPQNKDLIVMPAAPQKQAADVINIKLTMRVKKAASTSEGARKDSAGAWPGVSQSGHTERTERTERTKCPIRACCALAGRGL
jgi:hypothetical protein